jgi:hypothetical protein
MYDGGATSPMTRLLENCIVVRAYVVPGRKHDFLSFRGLHQSGHSVIYDYDEEESGVFAVKSKKIDKSKLFPFMSDRGCALKSTEIFETQLNGILD